MPRARLPLARPRASCRGHPVRASPVREHRLREPARHRAQPPGPTVVPTATAPRAAHRALQRQPARHRLRPRRPAHRRPARLRTVRSPAVRAVRRRAASTPAPPVPSSVVRPRASPPVRASPDTVAPVRRAPVRRVPVSSRRAPVMRPQDTAVPVRAPPQLLGRIGPAPAALRPRAVSARGPVRAAAFRVPCRARGGAPVAHRVPVTTRSPRPRGWARVVARVPVRTRLAPAARARRLVVRPAVRRAVRGPAVACPACRARTRR